METPTYKWSKLELYLLQIHKLIQPFFSFLSEGTGTVTTTVMNINDIKNRLVSLLV